MEDCGRERWRLLQLGVLRLGLFQDGMSGSVSFQHSARRPAEIAASKQMQMEMENGLARAAAVVQHRAVASEEIAFARKLCGDQLQLAQNRLIFGRGFGQRLEMLPRTDQNVGGRLRADVFKGKEISIFVDDLRRNLLRCDFADRKS